MFGDHWYWVSNSQLVLGFLRENHRTFQEVRTSFMSSAASAAKLLQLCLTLCDPIDWQPTRLPHPWDSPGKNTGVGCHFLLQCMKVKSESEVAQSCLTPSDSMDCSPPGPSVHGIFQARVLEWGAIAFSSFLFPSNSPYTLLLHFKEPISSHHSTFNNLQDQVQIYQKALEHQILA